MSKGRGVGKGQDGSAVPSIMNGESGGNGKGKGQDGGAAKKTMTNGEVAAKGKGKAPKKTPEERGFKMSSGGIYLRTAQLRCALPVKPWIEIGNLEKVPPGQPEALPRGSAAVEVLCNRQSVLGNPFNMTLRKGNRERDGRRGPPPKDESLRDPVCEAFERFFDAAMKPEASGPLEDLAVESALQLGLPRNAVGQDWAKDFGGRTAEELRAAFAAVEELVEEARRGRERGVRLLCHCVPLRCHCMALAARMP